MRHVGVLERPTAEPGTHVCWRFDDQHEFWQAAGAFLAEGLDRGERIVCVAETTRDDMAAQLAPALGSVVQLAVNGALLLHPVHDLYQPDGTFDAHEQIDRYRALVESALADGYTGLRVAADATALVRDEATSRRFAAYELAVDRFIAGSPMTAMCAYGPAADVSRLLGVHPLQHGGGDVALRGFYDDDPCSLRLAGEVDLGTRDVFALALDTAGESDDDEVVIDFADVTFIDVGGLVALARTADSLSSAGRSLRIANARPAIPRCSTLLDLDALAPCWAGPTR